MDEDGKSVLLNTETIVKAGCGHNPVGVASVVASPPVDIFAQSHPVPYDWVIRL